MSDSTDDVDWFDGEIRTRSSSRKKIALAFTRPELNHLAQAMRDLHARGEYYGNQKQFYKRSKKILVTLLRALELA